MQKPNPLVLTILDGWGCRQNSKYNAIAKAHTPQWDKWWQTRPHCLLSASGLEVGLPSGQMGNSEVGHMHIGAGRIVQQDFTRINEAIADGVFASNEVFTGLINSVRTQGKTLHILGLLSAGGVHSHEDHLLAFLALCKNKLTTICLHLFLDGRDTPPQSALQSLKKLKVYLDSHPGATITSISGRYFAMDRDQRWERVEPVYRLLTEGYADHHYASAEEAVSAFYREQKTDEFIPPTCVGSRKPIEEGDSIFYFNFRADRAYQLTQAFLDDFFDGFRRTKKPKLHTFISMTDYGKGLPTKIAFPTLGLKNTLGEVLANVGKTQLRMAETEKYAHVTYFLNGGSNQVFPREKRILVPSPSVATYDLHPAMSSPELTRLLTASIAEQAYDVIICNYANADMVGHTGDFRAAIEAIECLDNCLHQIGNVLASKGGTLLITADHGNAELMYDEVTQQAHTAHTSELVPFLYLGNEAWQIASLKGSLIDIAPTMLTLLGIAQPKEMTGHSLLKKNDSNH